MLKEGLPVKVAVGLGGNGKVPVKVLVKLGNVPVKEPVGRGGRPVKLGKVPVKLGNVPVKLGSPVGN